MGPADVLSGNRARRGYEHNPGSRKDEGVSIASMVLALFFIAICLAVPELPGASK